MSLSRAPAICVLTPDPNMSSYNPCNFLSDGSGRSILDRAPNG